MKDLIKRMNQYCKDEMDRFRAMEKILVEFVKKNGGYIDTDIPRNSAINIIAFDEFEEKYKEYYVRAVRVADEHIEVQLVKPFPIDPEDDNWYALLGGEIMINSAVYSLCEILPEYTQTIKVGDQVIWHDPDEEARDLTRIYNVYRVSDDIVFIADEWGEAEVPPSELEVVS